MKRRVFNIAIGAFFVLSGLSAAATLFTDWPFPIAGVCFAFGMVLQFLRNRF